MPSQPPSRRVTAAKIGDTLIDIFAAAEQAGNAHEKIPAKTPAMDRAFVSALYNGLTEAILAVQFGSRRIVHWNKGAEVLFGYNAEDILGQTTEIIYPDQHSFEQISALATPKIRDQGSWQSEWTYRRRDGSHFPADVVATMIHSPEGAEFYVIVIRDISAKKETEAMLQKQSALLLESRQRLQAILDNTTTVIYIAGSDGKFGLVNKRFEELFHVDGAKISGTPLHVAFDKKSADTFMANNAQVLAAKTAMEFEETIPQQDGFHTYLSVKVPLLDEGGAPYAICGISTDITGRKRNEKTIEKMNQELEGRVMERTAELQAANEQLRQEILNRRQMQEKLLQSERMAAIGLTTAKLAHEIANPLQTMTTALETLEDSRNRYAAVSQDVLHSTLRTVRAETDLMISLLDEFREIARPLKLEIQAVDLRLLANEVLMSESSHYAKCGVRIEENFATDTAVVAGDPIKLKQVLLNLLKNACEAMPQGGTITLRVYREAMKLVLEVRDAGIGIPEGIDVFELFTSSKPLGTGLGLAIVKDIVAAHHGSITYTSEPEKGTTFQLRLPLLRNLP